MWVKAGSIAALDRDGSKDSDCAVYSDCAGKEPWPKSDWKLFECEPLECESRLW